MKVGTWATASPRAEVLRSRAANAVPDDDGALAAWFTDWCARAVKGEVGLACDPRPSTKPFVYAVSKLGDVLSRSDDARPLGPSPRIV